ncbi:putative N-acetylglucosamine-6-phosphate deacetylase, partial [Podila epigama]
AFGVDFSVPSDHDSYEKDLLKVNRGLLKYGTTSYCPTIVSSSAAVYHKVLPHLKPRSGSAATGATVLGAHVEGPFINEARIGAHELKVLQANAKNGYKDFKKVYGFEGDTPEAQKQLSEKDLHSVKIITCAPELEGVMDSIPDLVRAGITVSVGHSMANISQAEDSVRKGATFITHLFNAMPQFHHRDPGVIGLLGSRPDLPRPYYGLICDGIHVHPNSVKIAYDSHPEGVILVTDAMSAMGLSPGNYQLGNMSVTKEEDRVYIEGTDTLAGSAGSTDTKRKSIVGLENSPLDLDAHEPSISFDNAVGEVIIETQEYDVYEEYEGSEHSLRIFSIHCSDEDDEAHEYFHSRSTSYASEYASEDSREFFGYSSTASEVGQHGTGTGAGASQESLVLGFEGREGGEGQQSRAAETVAMTMTECGCAGAHHKAHAEKEEEKKKNVVARTDNVTTDGDFCCPSTSVITLDACIRNFIQFTSCSVVEALEAVTLHPAVLLGIQETKGVIMPGADADLVFLDPDLYVKRVFVAGEEVDLNSIDVQVTEKF